MGGGSPGPCVLSKDNPHPQRSTCTTVIVHVSNSDGDVTSNLTTVLDGVTFKHGLATVAQQDINWNFPNLTLVQGPITFQRENPNAQTLAPIAALNSLTLGSAAAGPLQINGAVTSSGFVWGLTIPCIFSIGAPDTSNLPALDLSQPIEATSPGSTFPPQVNRPDSKWLSALSIAE